MKIASWNINALKAHETAFRRAIALLQPDIFCLQEIRVREDQQTFPVKGYRSFMNPADLSQYYGTGVYVRSSLHPLCIEFDRQQPGEDYEGRIIAVELDKCFVVCSYWPFSSYSKDGHWLQHRLQWNAQFIKRVHEWQQRKPVIICGDMNIVHTPKDTFDGKTIKKAGCFYPEERDLFNTLLHEEHLMDAYRTLYPESIKFSTWANSKDDYNRRNNLGFRIDYFLVSQSLIPLVKSTEIHDDIAGSDHCPISLEIEL